MRQPGTLQGARGAVVSVLGPRRGGDWRGVRSLGATLGKAASWPVESRRFRGISDLDVIDLAHGVRHAEQLAGPGDVADASAAGEHGSDWPGYGYSAPPGTGPRGPSERCNALPA